MTRTNVFARLEGVKARSMLFFGLGAAGANFVWVVPSFRSETLRPGSASYASGGAPSPWDRDVDDALALVAAAAADEPAADPARVGVSRLQPRRGLQLV